MKKKSMLIAGILMLTMIFSLVGCGKDGYDENGDSEDEKITYTDLDWPESDIVKTIPVPKSKKGHANWESSDGYNVDIINMTKEDYKAYVKECQKAGYTVDYDKSDELYTAKDKHGNCLSVSYDKDDDTGKYVMWLEVTTKKYDDDTKYEPETNTASNANNTDVSESEAPSSSSGSSSADKSNIRPDVKKAIDSYEKFMNKYVSFMKKYSESDDTTSMMKDYNSYMKKYADFAKKFKKLKDKKLNDDELAYYMEVESRVSDKLATIE